MSILHFIGQNELSLFFLNIKKRNTYKDWLKNERNGDWSPYFKLYIAAMTQR